MHMIELTSQDDVQNFVKENNIAVIFKAGGCRQTREALRKITPFFKKHPGIPAGKIDVVQHRDASAEATNLSGKKHESPQILLFRDGQCVYDANHWRIEGISLIDAIESFPGE